MTEFLSVALGIGLAAACGFRVFVPLLFVSIAAKAGKLTLVSSFQWMGSDAAMIAFSVATAIEIAAYYIPCSLCRDSVGPMPDDLHRAQSLQALQNCASCPSGEHHGHIARLA